MSEKELSAQIGAGRQLLQQAASVYGRTLNSEEYWWLGVGLAAIILAQLDEKPYAVGRLEQLMEWLGQKGTGGDWFQRFTDELAQLDAEGLLWPLYQRSPEGPLTPTDLAIHPGFDAEAGYFLALGHIAVAAAVSREDQASVGEIAAAIAALVESGLSPEHEATILSSLQMRS